MGVITGVGNCGPDGGICGLGVGGLGVTWGDGVGGLGPPGAGCGVTPGPEPGLGEGMGPIPGPPGPVPPEPLFAASNIESAAVRDLAGITPKELPVRGRVKAAKGRRVPS